MNTEMTPTKLLLAKAERLSRRLIQVAITQKELADRLGVSRQTIHKLTKGHQNINREWAHIIAPHLKTTEEYLLLETDRNEFLENSNNVDKCLPISTLSVPAGAGGGYLIEANPETWGEPSYFDTRLIVERIRVNPEKLCSIQIEGQSMEPILNNGDTVLVNMEKNNVTEPGIFVIFDGDGIVCKWVERIVGSEPAQYRIKSENKRFSEYTVLAEQTQIIGRVVWFGRVL